VRIVYRDPEHVAEATDAARPRASTQHLRPIMVSGALVGVLLALSTVVARSGRPWFMISLGIVVGTMLVGYVAAPARLIGVKPVIPPDLGRADRWTRVIFTTGHIATAS
jgi:predicted membrane protein